MPQINLLSTETKQHQLPWEILFTIVARLLVVGVLALFGYYGYIYYNAKTTATKIFQKQNDIISLQNDILNREGRKEVLVRQAQLLEATRLLTNHLYWSQFLPGLARVTLKSSAYIGVSADNKGAARLSVVVPDYTNFDKYLQVFDSKDFNTNFSNVHVINVSKYEVDGIAGVKFDVELTYNLALLKPEK